MGGRDTSERGKRARQTLAAGHEAARDQFWLAKHVNATSTSSQCTCRCCQTWAGKNKGKVGREHGMLELRRGSRPSCLGQGLLHRCLRRAAQPHHQQPALAAARLAATGRPVPALSGVPPTCAKTCQAVSLWSRMKTLVNIINQRRASGKPDSTKLGTSAVRKWGGAG